jgi:hypothetical protein
MTSTQLCLILLNIWLVGLNEAYDFLPPDYSLDDYKNNDIYVVFSDYLPEIIKSKNYLIASFRPICVLIKWTLFKPA